MPPRVNQGQSSFSVSQEAHQVVCPLKNQDGTSCRKRCLGEKRYRSMQEHIRRAHPEHYIPKLPATEESFQSMINTPPSERPPPQPSNTSHPNSSGSIRDTKVTPAISIGAYGHERGQGRTGYGSPTPHRSTEDQYPAAATAAVALAQLHNQRQDSDWGSEADNASDRDSVRPTSSYDLPPIQNHLQSDGYNPYSSPRPRELLPSMLARSPPGRSTTLPPLHRPRPRKSSVTQNARKPKHERQRSKEYSRRLSIEGRAKAMSAEPQPSAAQASYMNKRWEDLVEAAASANEADSDRDLTPIPQSPPTFKRSSSQQQFGAPLQDPNAYKASPLQRVLTPPPPDDIGPEPFPSVESSLDSTSTAISGTNFHMPASGLSNSDSSPPYNRLVQIYCANCRRTSLLRESYACGECISGFCGECVYMIGHRPCPRCRAENARYRPIQLELRP